MKRGRVSAGALAIASAVVTVARPDPPLDLTPEQSDVWRSIVAALPAEWFRPEAFPILAQLCRHTVDARRLAQLIDQECARSEIDAGAYALLLQAQARESNIIKTLSTALRCSPQSSMHVERAGRAKVSRSAAPRPWE